MSSGGLTAAEHVPGQGRAPVRPGGRRRRHAVETARLAGFGKVIGFDMGGTSTDVCAL
jgi:5-oxoprolinase (ATP-hydrolysing)